MRILNSARATATGGRSGTAVTCDGAASFHFAPSRQVQSGQGAGQTPEHLFAACFSACFLDAIQLSAVRRHAKLARDSTVTAQVGIGKRENGTGYALDVGLVVSLPEIDPALARDLVEEARSVCAYFHATQGGVDLRVTVS